jgi:hypothetical protein
MADDHKEPVGEVETALLDAELFIKYGAPDRALKRLKSALERSPRSINLRERMREIAASHKHPEEAARHCLALASLYIERDNFDAAHDRLLEAKQLDGRISIASGLEAIRRARHPELKTEAPATTKSDPRRPGITLAGDLSVISVLDLIQTIENSRMTARYSPTARKREKSFLTMGRSSGLRVARLWRAMLSSKSWKSPAAISTSKDRQPRIP